jgi:arylsulfatase A-like enzyme
MKTINMLVAAAVAVLTAGAAAQAKPIIHDAEHYILEAQNADKWAADDKAVDAKLEAFREKNGGKPPNIVYILIDDIGYGDLGSRDLNVLRGYKTPSINSLAREGMRISRMYTEPSCTPTRCAFMTGRQPHRYGMGNTQVDISGEGLPAKEVTLAEVLSKSGYNTTHIGKWHMGDIMESWPTHQGFDFAAFPIHQQAQLTLYHDDAAHEEVAVGIGPGHADQRMTLDHFHRPDPSAMATAVEGKRGKKVREVHMKPGERWTEKKYHEMNVRYQEQTLEHLRKMAAKDEPFFLNYWPLYPLTGPRTTTEKYTTLNGGTYVEKMKLVDKWVGQIMAEMETLGVADNTIVIVMGDNGHFTKYSPQSGYTPMIFRGGKGDATEGGVRVDAFVRWPGMIEADSAVGDIFHVADLFTTLARFAGATEQIPTDRLIDGVDQSSMLLLGETHGRRDYIFIYQLDKLAAVVKERFKLFVPGPGENLIAAPFYDLYRDTREEWPVGTEVGAWGGQEFGRLIGRHMMRKQKYPSEPPARGIPYDGVENQRPETEAAVKAFLFKKNSPMM